MSKAILKMVSLLVELTKYVLCCKTLLLARIKAFFQIPIPVYTMTCTVYTFPQTLATVYRGCAREKVKLFKKRHICPSLWSSMYNAVFINALAFSKKTKHTKATILYFPSLWSMRGAPIEHNC